MKLLIDSTDANGPEVIIFENEVEATHLQGVAGMRQAQQVLPLIDQALQNTGFSLQDVTEVKVNCGPGSFTGTRVGVALANALALALNVPINDQPAGSFVAPIYESAPKITSAKAKF